MKMNTSQAKLIVHNPKAYSYAKVQEAAVYLLGSLHLSNEDFEQAALVFNNWEQNDEMRSLRQ